MLSELRAGMNKINNNVKLVRDEVEMNASVATEVNRLTKDARVEMALAEFALKLEKSKSKVAKYVAKKVEDGAWEIMYDPRFPDEEVYI